MRAVKFFDRELLILGAFTALVLGALTKGPIAGIKIASFYLFIQYIPYLPWTTGLNENALIKYVVINILGFFFNPMAYYLLNVFGAPINLATIITFALITLTSGIIFSIKSGVRMLP